MYAGTSASKALEVIDLVLNEFRSLKETPLSDEELTRAKDQLKGNILLGLESSNARMANLARQEMYFHKFFSVDEVIAHIDEVECRPCAGHGSETVRSGADRRDPAGPPGWRKAEPDASGVLKKQLLSLSS